MVYKYKELNVVNNGYFVFIHSYDTVCLCYLEISFVIFYQIENVMKQAKGDFMCVTLHSSYNN